MAPAIITREYRPGDAAGVVAVYRDALDTLRQSRGGMHPEGPVDKESRKKDSDVLAMLVDNGVLYVAEVQGTGEIVGIGGLGVTWKSRLFGSAYSRAHYVKSDFQRGKAGVNVGALLRYATVDRARKMGFRKLFGHSTPEAVGFHKKFGARFFPEHNLPYMDGLVHGQYYEIELRPSILNGLHLEPYLYDALGRWYQLLASVKRALRQ